ncbi:Zinc finger protein 235 [Eumeta japonica]|uniref:Zinc finger protein 235 n=1 Tax=Eumeta variegata TaxID=151549 RepID=A0A4C1Y628_EUMVA|nr:Zinc finger protein 235 [Eumeta japonica]
MGNINKTRKKQRQQQLLQIYEEVVVFVLTASLRLAAGTGVEDDHCERIDEGPSRDGCGAGPRTADGPRREVVEEVGAPGRCGSRSPKECDCGKDGCKAYTCTSGEVFYCDYCNYDTMRRCDLLQHIRTHKCKKPYTCEYCDFKTPYSSILKQHALIHTGVKPYACVRCDFKTSYSSYMKKHVLIHTGEKPYTCVLCEYSVNRKDRLQTHMRIHMGGKPYECEQCTYRTFHMGNFKRHIRTHRGKRFLTLKPHSYSPFQVRYSKMHMPTHPRVKPFRYELCEFSGSELDSREPVLTHMGGESSNCEQFEGNTSLLSELKVQTTTHICAKLYECELCEYSASTLGNSENHIDSHREEKQQGCEQSEYAARPNGDLKTYTHTRQSPHKCEQEEEFGISLSNLKKDTHSHTAESPVECEQREYSASPRGHVKAPLRTYERKRRIEVVYFGRLHSPMSYGALLWGRAADVHGIFVLQKRAIRAISGLKPRVSLKTYTNTISKYSLVLNKLIIHFASRVFHKRTTCRLACSLGCARTKERYETQELERSKARESGGNDLRSVKIPCRRLHGVGARRHNDRPPRRVSRGLVPATGALLEWIDISLGKLISDLRGYVEPTGNVHKAIKIRLIIQRFFEEVRSFEAQALTKHQTPFTNEMKSAESTAQLIEEVTSDTQTEIELGTDGNTE